MIKVDSLIINAKELLTLAGSNRARTKNEMNNLGIIKNGAIAIEKGKILAVSSTEIILKEYSSDNIIEASNHVVMPGFVDPHTHPIFVNTRENEYEMRLQGKTYVDISKAGGGILSSINAVRLATEEELFNLSLKRIKKMIKNGTTTLEAKSGYGLTTDSEVKMLKVIQRLQNHLSIDIVPTLMGAHEIPLEYRSDREAYIQLMIDEMMPEVKRLNLAKYVDIFTEDHVYTVNESRRILQKAIDLGFGVRMHADEIIPIGGAELAGELNAVSADHLGACSDQGISAMIKGGTIATLLPGTLFSLGFKNYARARDMIDQGLPVALATDYNPGSCNCDNMQFIITLACQQMKMTIAEAITASTFNSACTLGMNDLVGSIEVGKQADILIMDMPSYQFLPYHFGSNNVQKVIKKGQILFEDLF